MSGKIFAYYLDNTQLQSDFRAAALGYKKSDAPLYTAYLGRSETSLFPVCFIANGRMSVSEDNPDLSIFKKYSEYMPGVKFTGIILNSDYPEMYEKDVTYNDVAGKIRECSAASDMVSMYKDMFAKTLVDKMLHIYECTDLPIILLPTNDVASPAIG